jgi:Polyketide cyclase / dehydrase and lipid transport
VSVGGRVKAAPARVYGVIADYREHHPRIIPPEYFRKLEVLAGGVGAGTRTRVEMRVLGATRTFDQVVTEPEPGRVLMEANSGGQGVTTFTVEDAGAGETQVTITTELDGRPGLAGTVERLLTSTMLRRIYRKEIARLAEYVARE